eukprot:scaffold848_cov247-Pinguiococcus_pyrenoidosus.AAC.1
MDIATTAAEKSTCENAVAETTMVSSAKFPIRSLRSGRRGSGAQVLRCSGADKLPRGRQGRRRFFVLLQWPCGKGISSQGNG